MKASRPEIVFSGFTVENDPESDGEGVRVVLRWKRGGFPMEYKIDRKLLSSAELREANTLFASLRETIPPPYRLEGDGNFPEADGPLCLLAQLLEAAQKGHTIQRYKGLGEMNPEQLWETAMDPSKRDLLRVEIGEGEDADIIFSELMGDLVEPRRRFIETNALNVSTLDI
jgi:DNA gyrase subunit B